VVDAAEASFEDDFLDRELFFGEVAVEFEESAAVAESAESDFLERLLDFGLAEESPEAAVELESVVAESDFLDLDLDLDLEVVAVEESAVEVPEDCVASSEAALFLDFFFGFVDVESV
jgi:hypothetical protein